MVVGSCLIFFFNDTATTEIYTLSLHDALPICSMFDLPLSVKPNNLSSMLGVARTEMALTRYLIGELLQSRSARHRTLTAFVPLAEQQDWEMITAGQREQVIKRSEEHTSELQSRQYIACRL